MAYAAHQQTFFDKVWNAAVAAGARLGIDPRIIFAQAALESNWGRSELTTTANNYFGIKAVGNEPFVLRRTREVINGVSTYVNAKFKSYANAGEGLQGYADFILKNPRYKPFLAAVGLDAQLNELQKSGYATDPQYSTKLRQVINNLPAQARNFVAGAGQRVSNFQCPHCSGVINAVPV